MVQLGPEQREDLPLHQADQTRLLLLGRQLAGL